MHKPHYTNQSVKIFNSLHKQKEPLVPLTEGHLGMYVCGPTVYSHVHLGNCRTFISFDLIYRYLKFLGYTVRYVRNITDAGHLEDSLQNRRESMLEKLEPMEVVQRYTIDFHHVLNQFNALPPNIEPTATGHILDQIGIIQKLLAKGLAYESEGSVYFDVTQYNEHEHYGELSNRNIDELLTQTRTLDGQDDKRNPQDFALWKKASPQHIMRWNSPWSEGFPGWHLECTAMSTKYLGIQFDIHGGGMDLKFPHHECEIAQARGANGVAPVSYWVHANMLTLNGQKMSKSTGNTILPSELFTGQNTFFEKAFSPTLVRFFMLQAHYRGVLDLSNEAMVGAEKAYYKLMESLKLLDHCIQQATTFDTQNQSDSTFDFLAWKQSCFDAMNDDFNSPMLLAQLFEATRLINNLYAGNVCLSLAVMKDLQSYLHGFIFDVLGLEDITQTIESDRTNDLMQVIIALRNEARIDKNWNLSDRIREKLSHIGILLKDEPSGTIYEIEK